jgi:WD40 repeat protein
MEFRAELETREPARQPRQASPVWLALRSILKPLGGDIEMLIPQHRMADVAISHAEAIQQVRFCGNSVLATCGRENRIRLWDWPGQKRLQEFAGSRFAFAPQGDVVYVATSERRRAKTSYGRKEFTVANLVRYDVQSGKALAEAKPAEVEICALAVSPAGKLVAMSRLTQAAVFHDAQTLTPLFELKHPGKGTFGTIHFLDENRVLTKGYTGRDYDEVAYLWDLRSRKPILSFSPAKWGLSVSADGRFAAAGTPEIARVGVWDLSDGKLIREFSYSGQGWVMDTVFCHHASLLAGVGQGGLHDRDGRLNLWNIETGELEEDHQPAGNPLWIRSVCISPDDRWLVAGGGDGRVRVWDRQAQQEISASPGHAGKVQAVVCLDREWLLSSGGDDHAIRRWNLSSGTDHGIERAFEEADRLVYHRASGVLASTHYSMVRLWRPRMGTISGADSLVAELPVPTVFQLCFSRDGRRLVSSGTDGMIRVWDLETQGEIDRLQVHDETSDSNILGLVLSPDDSKVVFTQVWSSRVGVWDWQSGTEIIPLSPGRRDLGCLAFSPDGRWLAAGGGDSGEITVWQWPDAKLSHQLDAESGHINALAFSPTMPDLLASADGGGDVQVFDLRTDTRVARMSIESGQAWSLTFSPDGDSVIAGSEFGVIATWKLVYPHPAEVNRWLTWNNGTVAALARSIRDDNKTDLFPILADALQDAGCTHPEVLKACHPGAPETSRVWVQRLLLGKE